MNILMLIILLFGAVQPSTTQNRPLQMGREIKYNKSMILIATFYGIGSKGRTIHNVEYIQKTFGLSISNFITNKNQI